MRRDYHTLVLITQSTVEYVQKATVKGAGGTLCGLGCAAVLSVVPAAVG